MRKDQNQSNKDKRVGTWRRAISATEECMRQNGSHWKPQLTNIDGKNIIVVASQCDNRPQYRPISVAIRTVPPVISWRSYISHPSRRRRWSCLPAQEHQHCTRQRHITYRLCAVCEFCCDRL